MRHFGPCCFAVTIVLLLSVRLGLSQPVLARSNASLLSGRAINNLPRFLPASLQTNPLTATIRFAVIGDYGSGSADETAVANLVKSWKPDFIITTGDNNYPSGAASTIDGNIGRDYHDFIYPYLGSYTLASPPGYPRSTQDSYPYHAYLPLIETVITPSLRFFPALGNHDWLSSGAKPYLDYFVLPGNERYYNFVRGPVHFFALDSDYHEPDGISSSSVQGMWLRNGLAASTACWNLVYLHHAPFSSGLHGSNTALQWPYPAWGVDAVLAGHDHDYERIVRNGFPYFVNGLGGSSRYSFGPTPVSGSELRYNRSFGAMLITASQGTITYEFIAVGGTVVDSYTQTGGCL